MPESKDPSQARWFVVQLVTSDRPINLDTMPRLEVFDSYRLYTVAGRQDDGNVYALRAGFFSDDVSANTLCGYLKTFFAFPSVVRVSAAEHDRFQKPASAPNPAVRSPASKSPLNRLPAEAPPAVAQPVERKPVPVAKKTSTPQRAGAPKSLGEQLLAEAREVALAKSGRHPAPQPSGSWISRLLGGSKS